MKAGHLKDETDTQAVDFHVLQAGIQVLALRACRTRTMTR